MGTGTDHVKPTQLTEEVRTHEQVVQFTARQLLAAYLQAGSTAAHYNVEHALNRSEMRIGEYQVRNLETLLRLAFVLSERTERFLQTVDASLSQLRSNTCRTVVKRVGLVRGAVNWALTVPAQAVDPTVFFCVDARRSFKTPVNEMLAYVIESIGNHIEAVCGKCLATVKTHASGSWQSSLVDTRKRLHRIRTNAFYQQIPQSKVANIRSRTVDRAKQRRSTLRCEIVEQYVRLSNLRKACRGDRELALDYLVDGLRWPDPDKLFELFTLFAVVESLRRDSRVKPQITPIRDGGRSEWFAKMTSVQGTNITVFYQHLPKDVTIQYGADVLDKNVRTYSSVMQQYGKRFGVLRPDIVVDCRNHRRRRLCIIEVKNTQSEGTVAHGLRELIDYCMLIRRRDGSPLSAEIIGMLGTYSLPRESMKFGVGGEPFQDGMAITSMQRMLKSVEEMSFVSEIGALCSYCWFQE